MSFAAQILDGTRDAQGAPVTFTENIFDGALAAFAAYIEEKIPALVGRVKPDAEDEEGSFDGGDYPQVRVLKAGRFRNEPWLSIEAEDNPDPSHFVIYTGTWEGQVEIRIRALSKPERGRIEQAILDLFNLEEGDEHTVTATIPNVVVSGVATRYGAPAYFSIGDEGWGDEMVFEKKRQSSMFVDAWIPELALRDEIPFANEIRLAMEYLDGDGNVVQTSEVVVEE